MKGTLFAFEGIGCSGKSTCLARLKEHFPGEEFLFTCEPGGTPYGKMLREAMLSPKPEGKETQCFEEMLPMMADRAYHVRTVIEPALARGVHVITDRFYGSTWAYQVFDRGTECDRKLFDELRDCALGDMSESDVHWVYFDISVAESLKRKTGKEEAVDQFDDKAVSFWERVRNGYEDFFTRNAALVVDATQSKDAVAEEVIAHIEKVITT